MKILCPGCGFGMWHNWGVLSLNSKQNTYIAISGSTLSVVCFLCNLNVQTEIKRCMPLRRRIFWNFRGTLRKWLIEALPDNSHIICEGKLIIVCRMFPSYKLITFTHWKDKHHLIETLIAACCPFFPHSIDGIQYTDCISVYDAKQFFGADKILASKTVRWPPSGNSALKLYEKGCEKQ